MSSLTLENYGMGASCTRGRLVVGGMLRKLVNITKYFTHSVWFGFDNKQYIS